MTTPTGEAAVSGAPEPLVEEIYTFPRCHNDLDETERVESALRAELGDENVAVSRPLMGSEDFGHLADSIGAPSVFWMFGGFDLSEGEPPVNHSPYFGPVLEPTLTTGTRAAVTGILAYLGTSR
ncbi:zinc-binding metallopeptidase family protein [Nocardiopsis salina]|uniref:hypothetical protein n=1 Tax=Nocardiopsis salina TaxID=245836 RepID=UPI00034BA468|nr:hypothetical protein [Nocardiopsis salina]